MFKKPKLIEAIEAGDLTYVKNCGLSDKDINDKKYLCDCVTIVYDSDCSLLIIAVYFGHLNIVKYLIERGADVNFLAVLNYQGIVNTTPLITACVKGHTDIVKYLIAQGADVNITNFCRTSSLMKAIKMQHVNIIKLLVAAGADVNHHDLLNKTPLYQAIKTGNCEIIKLLVSHGATINNNNECSRCPYVEASELGSYKMMNMVINCHTDIKKIQICMDEALACSVEKGSSEMVTYLCDQGASVESSVETFNSYITILMLAAENNNFDMVKYLIQQGADPARLNGLGTRKAFDYTTNEEIRQYLLEQEENFLPVKANNMAAHE